jgi:hypothetical protein
MISDADLRAIADRLVTVPGLVGVMLGGSRARGEHTADSDIDLGLYYRPPLGIDALSAVATSIAGPAAAVTVPGAWGPWVDGGAWLTIDGQAVDWIYRDLDRVHHSWSGAQDGHYQYHFQVGHPLGFPDFAYAGEVALGVVLADPSGELTALHEATTDYPHALTAALVRGIDEARFLLAVAAKATSRADSAYVAGCLFRIVGVCAHALHARAGRWLINEKGAVDAVGRLSVAPIDFTDRAQRLLAAPGHTPHALSVTLEAADDLVNDVAEACAGG